METTFTNPQAAAQSGVRPPEPQNQVRGAGLEKWAYHIFLGTLFLVPLLILPPTVASYDVVKMSVIVLGTIISAILVALVSFKKKAFLVPRGRIMYAGYAVLASSLIAAVASPMLHRSFIGLGVETTTFIFILTGALVTYLAMVLFTSKERIFYAYSATILAFIIVTLYHAVRFAAGPEVLSFGFGANPNFNMVGRWNDLGVFFALGAILSFLTIELLAVQSRLKGALYAFLAVAVVFLAVINFSLAWFLIAFAAFALGAYRFILQKSVPVAAGAPRSTKTQAVKSSISSLTLILFVLAGVMMFVGPKISGSLGDKLGTTQIDVRPSWQLTLDIATAAIKTNPLFGGGPNLFLNSYLINKPISINSTMFWNVDFSSGVGYVPTLIIGQGLVGLLSIVIFFILYIRAGIALARKNVTHAISRYTFVSSYIISLVLWIHTFIYIPSQTILFLAFFFTGIAILSFAQDGAARIVPVSYAGTPLKRFFGSFVLIIVIVLLVAWAYDVVQKFTANHLFQKGTVALSVQGNVQAAYDYVERASAWEPRSDYYRRALSEAGGYRLNSIIRNAQSADAETIKRIGDALDLAIIRANEAIKLDPINYQNYTTLARIAEFVIPLKVQGSYENAVQAYTQAIALNPRNPGLYLALARLEASLQKYDEAKKYIGAALQLKGNYTDAVYLLAQIQVAQGQVKDAISSVEIAAELNPQDPVVFFQLGFLHYNNKDYTATVDAMTQAVTLNPQYANARYFLGLALSRLGRNSDAIVQFEEIAKTNPENQEVARIIANLKAGRAALSDAQPPADDAPEKRKTPPVNEKNVDKKTSAEVNTR